MKKVPLVLAIDFDETIANCSTFPHIECPRYRVAEYLWKLKSKGYYIIIWTCRHGEHLDQAVDWLHKNYIPYNKINQHHPQLRAFYGNDTRKIAADIYVDDKNLSLFPLLPWFLLYWKIRIKSFFTKKRALDVCYK